RVASAVAGALARGSAGGNASGAGRPGRRARDAGINRGRWASGGRQAGGAGGGGEERLTQTDEDGAELVLFARTSLSSHVGRDSNGDARRPDARRVSGRTDRRADRARRASSLPAGAGRWRDPVLVGRLPRQGRAWKRIRQPTRLRRRASVVGAADVF